MTKLRRPVQIHDAMKTILEANYYGPVEEVLAEDPGRVKSVGTLLDSSFNNCARLLTVRTQWI
jgi:hypothetical protein